MNRPLQITLAVILVIVLLPLLVAAGVLVWLDDGFPVFFRQQRSGQGGKLFSILKLRTMRGTPPAVNLRRPASETHRLTRIGSLLRASGLDEVPQLWNVIRGEMNLVGPRPLPAEYLDKYSNRQIERLNVRPGITGWAQINGRNRLSWEEKFSLDVWYVRNRSVWLDMRILVRSVFYVLRPNHELAEANPFLEPFVGAPSTHSPIQRESV